MLGAVCHVPVGNKALQPPDGNGFAFDSTDTLALTLAFLRTNAAADSGREFVRAISSYAPSKFPLRLSR